MTLESLKTICNNALLSKRPIWDPDQIQFKEVLAREFGSPEKAMEECPHGAQCPIHGFVGVSERMGKIGNRLHGRRLPIFPSRAETDGVEPVAAPVTRMS